MIQEPATQREAMIEGAYNLYRFNRGDIFNVMIYVALFVALFGICWLIAHGIALVPHGTPQPIHYGPVPTDPGFPRFKG